MKRGLRVMITWVLALAVCALYMSEGGIPALWQSLRVQFDCGLAVSMATEAFMIAVCLWWAGQELRWYWAWRRGTSDWEDAGREIAWRLRFQKLSSPLRVAATLASGIKSAYYELRRCYRRAQRRWPQRRLELVAQLRRRWSPAEWRAAVVVLFGEVTLIYVSYLVPHYSLNPAFSQVATLTGITVGNAIALVVWLAGDDDEGGHREQQPSPIPKSGHGVQVRLRVGWQMQQAKKHRTRV